MKSIYIYNTLKYYRNILYFSTYLSMVCRKCSVDFKIYCIYVDSGHSFIIFYSTGCCVCVCAL